MNWTRDQVNAVHNMEPSAPKQGRSRGVAPIDERRYEGRVYHSKGEMKFAMDLDIQKRCAAIADWKPQVPYPIKWPGGGLICKLICDFQVVENDGSLVIYEIKGWETDIWKLKRKLFAACYPRVRYVVVKV